LGLNLIVALWGLACLCPSGVLLVFYSTDMVPYGLGVIFLLLLIGADVCAIVWPEVGPASRRVWHLILGLFSGSAAVLFMIWFRFQNPPADWLALTLGLLAVDIAAFFLPHLLARRARTTGADAWEPELFGPLLMVLMPLNNILLLLGAWGGLCGFCYFG
jgi:hypothetical protein